MPHIDHHSKPYDEGTITKLEIFQSYVKAWLPTFIMQDRIKEVFIVDFFAGLGYDSKGVKGSPIRIFDEINSFYEKLIQKPTIINVLLNEFKKDKFDTLQQNCANYLDKNSHLKKFVKIGYFNKDFNEVFTEIVESTKASANLYIIDQSGIKFTNQENFNQLLKLYYTDFLFFISSSFFKRFGSKDEFATYLKIDEDSLNTNPYKFIHRTVLEQYKSLIPKDCKLKIFPFSIKKGANIYGIVFGSNHILGVEKFLDIVWKRNILNGEADYDIDDDSVKSQLELNFENPEQTKKLTKLENFNLSLEEFIKQNKIVTNIDLYYFTYEHGHIPKHTVEYLRKLKSENKIHYKGHPKINWDNVKNTIIVRFKWLF